jgi:hypothetical protein
MTTLLQLQNQIDNISDGSASAGESAVASVNGKTGVVVLAASDVGAVNAVIAGNNITVDNTDPANPIVTAAALSADANWLTVDTSGFTFATGNKRPCDVTAGGFTGTLPGTLEVGDVFTAHVYGNAGTNLLTVARNGHTITSKGVNIDPLGDGNLTVAEGETVVLVATTTAIVEIA